MQFYDGWFDVGYGLVIVGLIISLWASWNVKSTFRRYQNDRNSRGLTAAQVARQILDDNGLYQIRIEQIAGNLTDHYDPSGNVIRLSESVYNSTSVAAIGVAAHECGHAVQHEVNYVPMQVRSAIIPITQIGSRFWYIIFVLGMVFSNSYIGAPLQMIGILLFTLIVVFQLVTLPVEFNASRRAMQTLESRYILSGDELTKARKVLTAAALTYVAALLNGTELFQFAAGQCPVPVPAGRTGQATLCLSVLRRDRTAYYIRCGAFALQQAAPAEAGQHRAEHSPSGHLPASLLRPDPQPCSSQ